MAKKKKTTKRTTKPRIAASPTPSAGSVVSISELKRQPISVIKTEIPSLAKALGMNPAELIKTITAPGGSVMSGDCRCCGSDSW